VALRAGVGGGWHRRIDPRPARASSGGRRCRT
jgi:hypothetical protein